MPVSRTYRCLNCMEGTVTRGYDVSHLTRTCENCGEFERHVNQRVIDQYEAFEADPPEALDWASLDRERKLVVAERVARHGRSVESLADGTGKPAENGAADERQEAAEREQADESEGAERSPAAAESDTALEGAAETTDADADDGSSGTADEDGDGGGDRDEEATASEAADAAGDVEATEDGGEADGDAPAGRDSTPSGGD